MKRSTDGDDGCWTDGAEARRPSIIILAYYGEGKISANVLLLQFYPDDTYALFYLIRKESVTIPTSSQV